MKRTHVIFAIAMFALALGACSSSDNPKARDSGRETTQDEGSAAEGSDDDDDDDDTPSDGSSMVADAGRGRDGGGRSTDSGIDSGRIGAGDGGRVGDGGGSAVADSGGAADSSVADSGIAALDSGVPTSATDPEFDTCLAAVRPSCLAREMNTAALIETACREVVMPPIPLADGGAYGPATLKEGPYGGKVEWNEGAGTAFVNRVNIAEPICVPIGIDSFNEPEEVTADIKNLRDLDYSLYTIFRPACFKKGEKYPVITWANGTCGEMPGYTPLLSAIASHGFIIIASNSTWTATSPTDTVQLRALDYAKALNEDATSIFYQKLDLDNIGAMGHSQGAAATANADADPRIKSVIFWNTGTSNEKPFLNVSGERDVAEVTPASMSAEVNQATKPGAWVYHHKVLETGGSSTGHLVLMMQPERVVDMAVAWWKWQLSGDQEAKKMFVGNDCGLCNDKAEFEYGHNSLLQ